MVSKLSHNVQTNKKEDSSRETWCCKILVEANECSNSLCNKGKVCIKNEQLNCKLITDHYCKY